MKQRISFSVAALVVLYVLWFFFWSETATPRTGMGELPCELKWSVADSPLPQSSDIKTKTRSFVPIVGYLKGPKGWLWSPLCNVATGREYPDGIRAPEALPKEERDMLLRNARKGSRSTATMSDRTHVVRMFARCVPDLPSTPSAREQLPAVGLSVAIGVKGESAFFAGLMEMPESPGVYWIQLWCEFTTDETYSEFVPFAGGPVSEVSITVVP